jgi:hypothetical protein
MRSPLLELWWTRPSKCTGRSVPAFSRAYEEAFAHELTLRGIPFVRQPVVEIGYKGHMVGEDGSTLLSGSASSSN